MSKHSSHAHTQSRWSARLNQHLFDSSLPEFSNLATSPFPKSINRLFILNEKHWIALSVGLSRCLRICCWVAPRQLGSSILLNHYSTRYRSSWLWHVDRPSLCSCRGASRTRSRWWWQSPLSEREWMDRRRVGWWPTRGRRWCTWDWQEWSSSSSDECQNLFPSTI